MHSADIASFLERKGWTRQIAGSVDFDAAVAAIGRMLDSRLGLVVSGEYGVGKSLLCDILAQGLGGAFKVQLAVPDELDRLSREWREYYARDILAENVFLDDLGAELPRNEFGVRIEPAADFICEYHLRHAAGRRLIVSTNLNTEQFDGRYGGRVLSRLKDLCVPLRLSGKDKREWKL